MNEIASIGHVVRHEGSYRVHCARCGSGIQSQKCKADRNKAIGQLRDQGWHFDSDGLWRCDKCSGESERVQLCKRIRAHDLAKMNLQDLRAVWAIMLNPTHEVQPPPPASPES